MKIFKNLINYIYFLMLLFAIIFSKFYYILINKENKDDDLDGVASHNIALKNLANEDKKEKKEQIPEEDFDYYTPEEIELLDKYHLFSGNKFVDEEIYDIIMKCNKDEKMIKEELKQRLKEFERGDEYNWTEIGESEYIFL